MTSKPRIVVTALPADESSMQLPNVSMEALSGLLTEAKNHKPDLVLLPQYTVGDINDRLMKEKAELLRQFSIENSCYVVFNFLEVKGEERFSTSRILSREGGIAGEYKKTHRIDGIDLDLSLGDEAPVFDLDFGRVALISGSDVYIPELAEIYSLKGAEILLCSMGIEPLRDDTQLQRILKARSIADYFYVAASTYASARPMYMANNYTLFHEDTNEAYAALYMNESFNTNGLGRIPGRAVIYDLQGEIIASTGRISGIAVCDINLDIKRNIKPYIYGPGAIVYHQNQRGIFHDILSDGIFHKKDYPVKKPVISFVHMHYSDTIGIYPSGDLADQGINYEKLFAYINRAAVYSDLVICSEFSAPGNKLDDSLTKKYSQCARENHCYIAVNHEIEGVNTSLLYDRAGQIILTYEKVNNLCMMYEKKLPAGTELPVIELDFATVGIMVCADSYLQEMPRILSIKGVELIIFQSQSWGFDANAINEGVMRSWAIENSIFIANCNYPSSQVVHRSTVVDPTGETVFASNYNMEGIYSVRLDLDAAVNKCSYVYKNGRVAEDFNFRQRALKARRPSLYGLLANINI